MSPISNYSAKNIYESLSLKGKNSTYLSLSLFLNGGKLSSNLEYRISKLFDDQYFSSRKLKL